MYSYRRSQLCRMSQTEDQVRQADSVSVMSAKRLCGALSKRFVLAATEHLHSRIAKLSGRVRQLENALATLQAKYSDEPHPLLNDVSLLQSGESEDVEGMAEEATGAPSQSSEVIDAFGMLSISDHGISRFFGPTGGSETASNPTPQESPKTEYIPDTGGSNTGPSSPSSLDELRLFSHYFPFTPIGRPVEIQEQVRSLLPSWERATALVETYFEQVSWIFRGVTRVQLVDEMLPAIYERHTPALGEEYAGPHDLALIFIVFAIGALVEQEPCKGLAEHYHQIARAAISLQAVLEKPSIVTIQTLHLMSIYNAMSGSDLRSETSMEMTWSLITLASHLSQTVCLNRDSARWGLSPKMVQRRRILFWDLFVADVWQSLNTGRPPSFSLAYIDCSYPQYDSQNENQAVPCGSAFERWQFRFAAECVAEVTARTLTAEAPSYATIMELDRKVREFPLPEGFSNASPNDLATSFQRCVLDHIRETVLMYIHRSFFAQAIIEHPVNPLKSPYSPSFLAAYRASSTILKSIREQFSMWPNSCSRFWTMWTFAFTAAVVFGTVVTRGPRSPLAQSAMTELEQACLLFSKASVYSIRATKALPILMKLNERARYALASAQSGTGPQAGLHWNIKEGEGDDDLAIFAGHTRFVSGKKTANVPSQHDQACAPIIAPALEPSASTSPFSHSQTSHDSLSSQQPMPHLQATPTQIRDAASNAYRYPDNHPPAPQPSSTVTLPVFSHVDGWTVERPHSFQQQEGYASHVPVDKYCSTHSTRPFLSDTGYTSWVTDSGPRPHVPAQYHQPQEQASSITPRGIALHYDTLPRQREGLNQPMQSLISQSNLQTADGYIQTAISQHHPHPAVHHSVSMYQHQGANTADLADLGLASRDSRLDERWSSFMYDSGLLEGMTFNGQR
ncbi:hypothetical protein AX17_006967 [Amanita inopinata Kibby_2008]|nr:hypothetical protein AX17_006967 [Amanita inopinata Kibby_2008]